MNKSKILETSLVLTTGFLIVHLLLAMKVFLYLAVIMGLIGILIPPLAELIAKGWFKLADALNFVMSKVILGSLFYFVLFPISLMYRIGRRDKLQLRKAETTTWITRNYEYKAESMENIW